MRSNTIAGIMGRLIVQENGCCLWPMGKTRGYGRVSYEGRSHMVHRLLYEHFVGRVPEGMHLDHIVCDTPACGNFAHVIPAWPTDNMQRGSTTVVGNHYGARTHCKSGHPFKGDNLIQGKRQRFCRTCRELLYANWQRPADRPWPTHCRAGHLLDEKNTRIDAKGSPKCRECHRLQAIAGRARRKRAAGSAG